MSNKKNIKDPNLDTQNKKTGWSKAGLFAWKRQADKSIHPIHVPYTAARKQVQGVEAPCGAEASAIQKLTASGWAALFVS